ncbi:MAG: hypothetical protein JJT76_12950 [Clostridiaceae bacterium]|nr:hypothetical protein [Clostridiaceae bacterium]
MTEAWEREVTVDMLPDAHRQIAKKIGMKAFMALCEGYGGATLYIPKIDSLQRITRDIMIREDYQKGMTFRQMREKYNISESHIRRIVEEEEVPGQISLLE